MQHLSQFFPFIVAIIVILGRVLAKSGSGPTDSSSGPGTRGTGRPETEEERTRRFMEAVGLPKDAPRPAPRIRPAVKLDPPPPLLPVQPPNIRAGLPTAGRMRRATTAAVPPIAPSRGARTLLKQTVVEAAKPTTPIYQVAPAAPPSGVTSNMPAFGAGAAATGSGVAARAGAEAAPLVSTPAQGLLARLRDPASIRQAIILREVLGPPKGLQELRAGVMR
jgi:hypothetical protein